MIVLTGSKTLTAVLAANPATTQPTFLVAYADVTDTAVSEGGAEITATGTTPVTLLNAPAAGVRRVVKNVYCLNLDTAVTTPTVSANGVKGLSSPIAAGACVDLANPAGATSIFPAIAAGTLLGNNGGGSASPSALTVTQVRALLGILDYANPISVTAATTATLNRLHVCSGTAADYTVGLPTAVGNAGSLLGFIMAPSLSRWVTLDASGTETIDGALTRLMWSREVAILESNNTEWVKVFGKSIPMSIAMKRTTTQAISAATWTQVVTNTVVDDNTSGVLAVPMGDTTNGRAQILRPGTYWAQGFVSATGMTANVFFAGGVVKNNATPADNPNGWSSIPALAGTSPVSGSTRFVAAAGDWIGASIIQSDAGVRNTSTVSPNLPTLTVTELNPW